MMRENWWSCFDDQVSSFCDKHEIDVPDVDYAFKSRGRSCCKTQEITNLHDFRVEMFYLVIDLQLPELNDHFNEVNIELLLCVTFLCRNNLFFAFDKEKIDSSCQLLSKRLSEVDVMTLEDQLETYIIDMRSSEEFTDLKDMKDISGLAQTMVQTKKYKVYPLLILTLALILLVTIAIVDRVFSSMNVVKT